MNKNIEYELLTQDIYQTLLNAGGIINKKVQHNVKIKGKAYEHQIDVLWEYELEGVLPKCAIECKNYGKRISIGTVRDFCGVLLDIADADGIIVTKIGYQKGAKEYAQYFGINLKLIREPIISDWHGRVRETSITTTALGPPIITDIFVVIDKDWVKDNLSDNFSDDFLFEANCEPSEIWIRDNTGKSLKSIIQLAQELPYNSEGTNQKHFINWTDGFVQFKEYGLVKIKGISMTYEIRSNTFRILIDESKTAKAILKDVQTGEIKFFHKDGNRNSK